MGGTVLVDFFTFKSKREPILLFVAQLWKCTWITFRVFNSSITATRILLYSASIFRCKQFIVYNAA